MTPGDDPLRDLREIGIRQPVAQLRLTCEQRLYERRSLRSEVGEHAQLL